MIIISHKTAFLFWRRYAGSRAMLQRSRRSRAMTEPLRLTADLRAELAAFGITPQEGNHLDVLVSAGNLRSTAQAIRSHVCSSALPSGSLLHLSSRILIASPELTFLHLAEEMPLGKLIMAGCELCGTYALESVPTDPNQRLPQRQPLTFAMALAAFAESVRRLHGRSRAQRAVAYVFDNAASPMEAKLSLLLCLPHQLGGRNLPRPLLNAEIPLRDTARRLYPHRVCRADLYWEHANLDVEYDGDYHEGGQAHANGIARAAALQSQDITVLPVTYAQIADPTAFALIAEAISRKVGRTLRIRRRDFTAREAELRAQLRL